MDSLEPKKLALLRILEILSEESDCDHPLMQEKIVGLLDERYGISIERKAVGRNLALLKDAGFSIESDRRGSYLSERTFEDSELRLLIDGVLASRHIAVNHSKDLIEKLSGLSNRYFKKHLRHVCSVNEWSKTENKTLFYSIDVIDEAIENGKTVEYDYNKYATDKKLHKTSRQTISPYQLLLHNQRYYLMGYNKKWDHIVYHRLDRITNITVGEEKSVPLETLPGYEEGVDYRRLAVSMPYMYTDTPERTIFVASKGAMDQIIDWFGTDIDVTELDDENVRVSLTVSPTAMTYWALQYADCVTVLAPESLRLKIADVLKSAVGNYEKTSGKL